MDLLGAVHTAAGVAAMALGLAVIARRKGTRAHRRTGRAYVAAMLLLNGTAFAIYDLFGFFGPFHVAAVVSLATLAAGLSPIVGGSGAAHRIERHALLMSWSYGGLLAAAASELAGRVPGWDFGAAVFVATGVVLAGAAGVIHSRVPPIARRLERGVARKEEAVNSHPGSEDVSAIRRLVEESQRGVAESGKHYVLWGAVIAAGLCLTYAFRDRQALLPWIWAVALGVAWGTSFWLGWREAARAPVDSVATRTLAGIWIGCGVGMTLLGFLGSVTGAVRPGALPAVIAVVLGVGYFASSFAYRSAWIRTLAVLWWLSAAGLFLRPGPHTLLVLAGLLLLLQVVPGVVFHVRGAARRASAAA